VPPHQRKPSVGGLAGAMPIPKSDGAMVLSETGSSDYIHNEYEVDYSEVEVEKELARGSFGIVFTGRWRGTDVAIKKLVNQNLSQKELEEFHAEVNVMKKLHHPNVLLLMGVCSQPPNLCMICELMTGSLWDLLHRRKEVRLDWKLVMRFITDTARGMNYLHLFKPPVLHRDLKTPNLLVDKDFNVKIADFGLARLKAHVLTGNLGTCQYMAPEVLRNESYTESADVYSFGIIVWEIVARAPPFHGMQTMQIAYSVNQGMRPPIPSHCPLPLRDLMQRCWNQDPRLRPSFTAILNQIKGIKL
jgi:serine/threonine protein kinase